MPRRRIDPDEAQEKVPLNGMLAEFRTALEEEIEAAKGNPGSTVSLNNGQRIYQIGNAFQYSFEIESALNLPGDTPGELFVQGREQSLKVTILSVEGLKIVLSIEMDLGYLVPYARLKTDLTFLLQKLIGRIESKADAPNLAGDRILGLAPVSGAPQQIPLPPKPGEDKPNKEQQEAVFSCLGRDTTFIWGPPGTGKTRTIGAIGEQLFRRNRSLLLVSHTNTAVDEALEKIADALGTDFRKGDIVRVGDPVHKRLQQREELLLKKLAEEREAELRTKQITLEAERKTRIKELEWLERAIALCEWAEEGAADVAEMQQEFAAIAALDREAADIDMQIIDAANDQHYWETAKNLAQTAIRQQRELEETLRLLSDAKRKSREQTRILRQLKERLKQEHELLNRAEQAAPLHHRRQQLPTRAAQIKNMEDARVKTENARQYLAVVEGRLREEEAILERASSVGTIKRLWQKLPNPEEQTRTVEEWRRIQAQAQSQLQAVAAEQRSAEALLSELIDLETQLQAYSGVPDPHHQSAVVRQIEREIEIATSECSRLVEELESLRRKQEWFENKLGRFEKAFGTTPAVVLTDAESYFVCLSDLREELSQTNRERAEKRGSLETRLSELLAILNHLGLSSETDGTAEAMLAAVKNAHARATAESAGYAIQSLRSKKEELGQRVLQISDELKQIERDLKGVEEQIIAGAKVVATTLTRAYVRESIQSRSFDTVILDEASMAPIPALWVAASLATNAAVVGDFKQLPPIVQSNHPLAKQWLGRDIFDASRIQAAYECGQAPTHFVALREQFRMHPQISVIPNGLFYSQELRDAEKVKSSDADSDLLKWYNAGWGFDNPVLLVDTESTHAWVTSVPGSGGRPSRLNFLSATICVDLAEQFLSKDRSMLPAGERPRIIIVCPYRPHAKLLSLLIREQNLDQEIAAGTAHSFQGAEADVVILDLVVDEPHWRTNLTNPQSNEDMKRLLNVAVTRARRRLVIVGDFAWCMKNGRQSFLGKEFLPFLLKHCERVDALKIVPEGLAAQAAKAQIAASGGEVEPSAARLVVTQADFYPLLLADLARAKRRVVIYSPFMTTQRVRTLESQLRSTIDRGAQVFIVTKPRQDRKQNELTWYVQLEEALIAWGVKVIHKAGMHEKLVFVDDRILWSGSLNPLSYSNTQEIMERRESRHVVADFSEVLRLEDLLAPYTTETQVCPICGKEITAAEGGDSEPFYWRCVEDGCYSRSADDPPLKDGMIAFKCGGAVEYRKWGDKSCWFCDCGRRHRVRFHPNHLRLPRMVALIPERERRTLQEKFGIAPSTAEPPSSQQGELFCQPNSDPRRSR